MFEEHQTAWWHESGRKVPNKLAVIRRTPFAPLLGRFDIIGWVMYAIDPIFDTTVLVL